MNLDVTILPCPERERMWAQRNNRGPNPEMLTLRCLGSRKRSRITCFNDVVKWAEEINFIVNGKGGGAYFYYLKIGIPGGETQDHEMPHGLMSLEDRLWFPIDMHEAFYVEVP